MGLLIKHEHHESATSNYDQKVISSASMPVRFPVLTTCVAILMLHTFNATFINWVTVLAILAVIWFIRVRAWLKQEQVDVIEDIEELYENFNTDTSQLKVVNIVPPGTDQEIEKTHQDVKEKLTLLLAEMQPTVNNVVINAQIADLYKRLEDLKNLGLLKA